ncbi:ABC transporter permease [Streptosporangium sp. NPDC000396]|uniref:ABC transporter permease n=1 Tax=Streptosporangium sp. NPDC000396 TaxID=3366185 RepID=UPI0036B92C73
MTGTGLLLRLVVRAERVRSLVWILLIVLLGAGLISYINGYFPTWRDLRAYAEVISANPIFLGLGGPVDEPSIGAMAAWRSGGLLYLLTAWMAMTIVIRHTRAEEEAGRQELLLAGTVGRHAPLTAALIVAASASLLAGLLTSCVLIAMGIETAGSLAYGAAIAAAGLTFSAVAALAAQLAQSGRNATGLGLLALGVSYLLRYLGDASGLTWLTWSSPLGWSHLVRAYTADRWWTLAVSAGATAIILAVVYGLTARRDLGAGLLPVRPGHATGPGLKGPFSLAWRLQRGMLAMWAVGVAAAAALFAGLSGVAPRLADQPGRVLEGFIHRYGGPSGNPVDAYLRVIILLLAYTIALYPVLATLRLHQEEYSGRAEALLATGVSRAGWAVAHLVVAASGTLALLTLGGFVTGLIYSLLLGDVAVDLPRVLLGTLGHVPAAWLVGAIAAFAVGVLPRLSVALSWAAWGTVVVLGDLLGPLIGLWGWSRAEPFHYTPNTVAGAPFTALPQLVILALTAVLAAAALTRLNRRDFG